MVPCGHHVNFKADVGDGIILERSYTPVFATLFPPKPENSADRNLHFLIKIYEDGAFTQYLNELTKGHTISVSDHMGTFDHTLIGRDLQDLILVFGGTGFTPMAKVIKCFCESVKDKRLSCSLTILSFNKTVDDIIWREQVEHIVKKCSDLVEGHVAVGIHQILSRENFELNKESSYRHGRISLTLLKDLLPLPMQEQGGTPKKNGTRLCLICGPIPFIREAKNLFENELNYKKDEMFVFDG